MAQMIGRYDRRVEIQYESTAKNAVGQNVRSWVSLGNFWAKKLFKGGSETFTLNSRRAEASVDWQIRFNTDVTVKMRLVYENVIHHIEAIREVGRKEAMVLVTRAERNNHVFNTTPTVGFDITSEAGDTLVTEAGDALVTEV